MGPLFWIVFFTWFLWMDLGVINDNVSNDQRENHGLKRRTFLAPRLHWKAKHLRFRFRVGCSASVKVVCFSCQKIMLLDATFKWSGFIGICIYYLFCSPTDLFEWGVMDIVADPYVFAHGSCFLQKQLCFFNRIVKTSYTLQKRTWNLKNARKKSSSGVPFWGSILILGGVKYYHPFDMTCFGPWWNMGFDGIEWLVG